MPHTDSGNLVKNLNDEDKLERIYRMRKLINGEYLPKLST